MEHESKQIDREASVEILLHQENLEQRRHWKVLSFAMIFVVLVETGLLCYMSVKIAEKKEVVRYVEFSTKGNFGFKVLPDSNMNVPQKKLLIEQQLQQYVSNRVANVVSKKYGENEIDSSKFKFVVALSAKEVVKQYENEMMKIYENADFSKRDIHILSFSEIEDRKYRFDFKTIDTVEDKKSKAPAKKIEQRWVVHVKYDLIDPNDSKLVENKEANPLGIKVTYYRGDLDSQQKINIADATKK